MKKILMKNSMRFQLKMKNKFIHPPVEPAVNHLHWLTVFIYLFILSLSLTLDFKKANAQSLGTSSKDSSSTEKIFRAIYPVSPKSLDPHGESDPAAWPVIMLAYDRLMSFKHGTAEPDRSLIETFRVSSDGRQYTFILKNNYSFADGNPLNSEAVLYSFDRLMSSPVGKRYYPYLRNFEIIGPYSFRLILDRPWPPFLASLALPPASLVSPGLSRMEADYLKSRSLGSGKYQVQDWREGTIGLKAREDLLSRADIDFVMFHYESNGEERYKKAVDNSAHLVIEPTIPENQIPGHYQFREIPTFSAIYLAINTKRPYLNNVNIRRAMAFLLEDAYKNKEAAINGVFPKGLFYNSPAKAPPPEFFKDLAQARQYLEEDNININFKLIYISETQSGNKALSDELFTIKEAFSSAGLNLEYLGLSEADLPKTLETGDYDFYLAERLPDIPSPDFWLGQFLDSGSAVLSNPALFINSRADRLIDEIVKSVGNRGDGAGDYARLKKDQAEIIAQLAEIALLEKPYVFLYSPRKKMMVDVRLKDATPHPQWPDLWPIDQMELKAFSFRSGANPSGRPPAAKNIETD